MSRTQEKALAVSMTVFIAAVTDYHTLRGWDQHPFIISRSSWVRNLGTTRLSRLSACRLRGWNPSVWLTEFNPLHLLDRDPQFTVVCQPRVIVSVQGLPAFCGSWFFSKPETAGWIPLTLKISLTFLSASSLLNLSPAASLQVWPEESLGC